MKPIPDSAFAEAHAIWDEHVKSMANVQPMAIKPWWELPEYQPDRIAETLISVQPMTAPTGQIFKIRHVKAPWYKRPFQWLRAKYNGWKWRRKMKRRGPCMANGSVILPVIRNLR